MNLKQMPDRLRRLADEIDWLLGMDRPTKNETRETALRITKAIKTSKKGFRYNGTHWTQLPKNAAKVRRMTRRAARTRMNKDV